MRYRIYIYDTIAVSNETMVVEYINMVISRDSEKEWNDNGADRYLKEFDVRNIKAQIQNMLGDKCQIIIKYPPKKYKQMPYLYISTAFSVVQEVLPALEYIAAKNKLALYDVERDKTYYKNLVDDAFITQKLREKTLKETILKNTRALWRYNKIFSANEENQSAFVITVYRIKGVTFAERTKWFYECLLSALTEDETLECEDRTFKVCGTDYTISFLFEGYKEHANMIGFVENGKESVALLRRMSTYNAIKWIEQCRKIEKEDIKNRMCFTEMVYKYKNPGDRLAKSVNITKWQRREIFDIRYSGFGYYESEIVFNVVPECVMTSHISSLKIEEETASFILPFVKDVYPYIYDRYNLTENHLPFAMWIKFIRRLEKAKEMIVNDTFNPDLLPYIEKFNLYVLEDENTDFDTIKNNPVQFLYEHRYQVSHLYDVLIEWSDTQLNYYWGCDGDGMINIQGP